MVLVAFVGWAKAAEALPFWQGMRSAVPTPSGFMARWDRVGTAE
jgi:hypothetical protein